ncbi:MAG: hypothetical protein QG568_96 [Patescibacteria group bacterium]|nr:hypothetical protein [Patescibacteria group bacterium]
MRTILMRTIFRKILRQLCVLTIIILCVSLYSIHKVSAQTTQVDTSNNTATDFEPGIGDPSIPFTSKFPQIKEELVTEITPEIPKPGDTVTITTNLYGDINLNTTLITWRINGVVELRGIGKKDFTFIMGDSGKLTTVDFEAFPTNAPLITKSFQFAPVDVDILWQANTYTPPFYKGKALFTPESNVTFIALPNIIIGGKRVDPSEVVYNWKVDRTVDGENSGFGKSSYDFTGDIILKPTLVQAEVYAASNPAFKGMNGFQISHIFPQALMYEDSPVYGILFNKALRNQYTAKSDEVELSLIPFFFSTDGKNAGVTYKWNLNTAALAIPEYQNSAIFRRKDDKKGSASVTVTIGNPSKILQKATAGLDLLFNEKRSTFGQ